MKFLRIDIFYSSSTLFIILYPEMSTFSLADNFSSLFQLDVWKFVGTTWITCILLTVVVVNNIVPRLIGAENVISKPPFRNFKAIQMLYYPLVSCIVQPLLFILLAITLFGESTVRSWDTSTGIGFTTSVWFATSFHGIWLDYTSFEIPFQVPVLFWCNSLTHAIVTGYFLGYMM